jgi:hypothetical protein
MDIHNGRSHSYEDGTKRESAEESVKKNPVLKVGRYREKSEDNDENEKVIDRQRFFDEVSREELQRGALS